MIETQTLIYTIGASALILISSFIGVIFAWRGLRSFFESNLPYFVSFSAGVFVVVVSSLIDEIREIESNLLLIVSSILFGAVLIHTITKLFPGSHHHEDPNCDHSHGNVRNMFVGDAIHSFTDGILLAPAFIISPALGISTAIGILLHETVQELSEFFIYKKSSFTTKKALAWCFGSSAVIVPGALLGLYVSKTSIFITPLLGVAIGSFLYIILTDLIPDSYHQAKTESKYILHILSAILGFTLMWFVGH